MITVEPIGDVFVLRSMGEPCGPRLVKSDPFPLRKDRPWDYDTQDEAMLAAEKLEAYLAKHLKRKK